MGLIEINISSQGLLSVEETRIENEERIAVLTGG
jgi:hypothetical protein